MNHIVKGLLDIYAGYDPKNSGILSKVLSDGLITKIKITCTTNQRHILNILEGLRDNCALRSISIWCPYDVSIDDKI